MSLVAHPNWRANTLKEVLSPFLSFWLENRHQSRYLKASHSGEHGDWSFDGGTNQAPPLHLPLHPKKVKAQPFSSFYHSHQGWPCLSRIDPLKLALCFAPLRKNQTIRVAAPYTCKKPCSLAFLLDFPPLLPQTSQVLGAALTPPLPF